MKYKKVNKKQLWLPGFSRPVSAMKKTEKVIERGAQLFALALFSGASQFFERMRQESRNRFPPVQNFSDPTTAAEEKNQPTIGEKND